MTTPYQYTLVSAFLVIDIYVVSLPYFGKSSDIPFNYFVDTIATSSVSKILISSYLNMLLAVPIFS